MAVITNVDLVDESRVEELRTVLQVNGISDIFEVANITKEKVKLEETYQQSLLSLLGRCMVVGDESYIFKHYLSTEKTREREMMDRRDRIKREHQEQKRRTEEDETFQKLNVAMEKMMDENTVKDRYYKAIQKVECKHAPQVTVVAQKKKGDSTGGLAALGAGATAGALMGSVAGPLGAAIGAAAGATLSGVGYLFGKKK